MREPTLVARAPRREDGLGRAAGALDVRPLGVDPEAERHADGARARREERNRRVDAAAHRNRDPAGVGARADDRAEGVRERVHGQRLAADRGRLEQRQAAQVVRQAVRVGVDDPVAVDPEPDEREVRAARRVSDQLAHCPSR